MHKLGLGKQRCKTITKNKNTTWWFIEYCTVQLFGAKIDLLSQQTLKYTKTTTKWLYNTLKYFVFNEEIFNISAKRYDFPPLIWTTFL